MIQPPRFRRIVLACLTVTFASGFSLSASAQGVMGEWKSVEAPPPPKLNPVKVDVPKTALLVMDFNDGNCAPGAPHANPRCISAIPKVKQLLDEARTHHMLVIFTGYPHMSPIVKAIAPISGEPVLVAHADKFDGTNLDTILKDHGITTIIATGTAANGAVLFTAFGAANLGYKVIVPVDTMPGMNGYAEQSSIWGLEHDPGMGNMTTLTSVDRIEF
jgi:nicotinamidase-related amidase